MSMWKMNTPRLYNGYGYITYGSLTTYASDEVDARTKFIQALTTRSISESPEIIGCYESNWETWFQIAEETAMIEEEKSDDDDDDDDDDHHNMFISESFVSPVKWAQHAPIDRVEHSVIIHTWPIHQD
jgi:hypothetical protein